MKRLLIVDDARGARESLKAVFTGLYAVGTAADAHEALLHLHDFTVDLVFLDIIMPGVDGLELLGEILRLYPGMPVIMVSAAPGVRPAIEAIRLGAFDYVSKPFDVEEVRGLAERALQSATLKRQVAVLQGELHQEYPIDSIIGESAQLRNALTETRRAAESDDSVLFVGETGTGKELFARYLHQASRRQAEPFCPVNCAALPETLVESELFGYEKGAHSAIDRRRPGLIDTAASGTLFLDEVSGLPPSLQGKLLRVVEQGEFMRIGATAPTPTHARIVAASSRDLRAEAERGRFRRDLYHRLGGVPIYLPPLRDRVDDIPLLTYHYLGRYRQRLNANTRDLEPAALELLRRYPWPGNVRELRNVIERTLVLHGTAECIGPEHLPDEFHADRRPGPGADLSLTDAVRRFEANLIREALQATGGVQTQAADRLGITRRMLKYRMDRLGLSGEFP